MADKAGVSGARSTGATSSKTSPPPPPSSAPQTSSHHSGAPPVPKAAWMWKQRSRKMIEENVGEATASLLGVRRIGGKQWNRRFVSVEKNAVCYGKNEKKREKVIPLETVRAANFATRDVLLREKAPSTFVDFGWFMYINGKEILFCCESDKARKEWVTYIVATLQQMSGLAQPHLAGPSAGPNASGDASHTASAPTAASLVARAFLHDTTLTDLSSVRSRSARDRVDDRMTNTTGVLDLSTDDDDDTDYTYDDDIRMSELASRRSKSRDQDRVSRSRSQDHDTVADGDDPYVKRSRRELQRLVGGADEEEEEEGDAVRKVAQRMRSSKHSEDGEYGEEDEDDDDDDSDASGALTAEDDDETDGSDRKRHLPPRMSQAEMYASVLLPVADKPYSHVAYKMDSLKESFNPGDGPSKVVFSRTVEKIGKRDSVQERDLVLTQKHLYLFAKHRLTGRTQMRSVDTDQIIGVIESTVEPNLMAIIIPSYHDVLIRITQHNSRVGGSEVDVKLQLIAHLFKVHQSLNTGRQFIFREVENVRAVIRRSSDDQHLPLASDTEDRLHVGTNKLLFPILRTNADSIIHWSSMVTRMKADRRPRLCALVVTDTAFYFISDTLSKVHSRTSLSDITRLMYDRDSQTVLIKCVEVDTLFTVQASAEFSRIVDVVPFVASLHGIRIKSTASKQLYANAQLLETKKLVELFGVNRKEAVKKGLKLSRKMLGTWKAGVKGVRQLSDGKSGRSGDASGGGATTGSGKRHKGGNSPHDLIDFPFDPEDGSGVMARTPGSRLFYSQYRFLEELVLEYDDEEQAISLPTPFPDTLRIGGPDGTFTLDADIGEIFYSSRCGVLNVTALSSKPLVHQTDLEEATQERVLVVCTQGILLLTQLEEMPKLIRPIRELLGGGGEGHGLDKALGKGRLSRLAQRIEQTARGDSRSGDAGKTSGNVLENLSHSTDGRIDLCLLWRDVVGVVRCHRSEGTVVGIMTGSGSSADVMIRVPTTSLMEFFVAAIANCYVKASKSPPFSRIMVPLYAAPRPENVRNAMKKTVFDPSPTIALRRTVNSAVSDDLGVAVVPDIAEACRRYGDNTIYFSGVAWRFKSASKVLSKEKEKKKKKKEKAKEKSGKKSKDGDKHSDAKDGKAKLKPFILILTNCAVYQCTVNGYEIIRRTELLDIKEVFLSRGDPDLLLLTVPKEYDLLFRVEQRGREFLSRLQEAYTLWTPFDLYLPHEAPMSHMIQHYFVPVHFVAHVPSAGRLQKPAMFDKQQANRSAANHRRRMEGWHRRRLVDAIARYESAVKNAAEGLLPEKPTEHAASPSSSVAAPRALSTGTGSANARPGRHASSLKPSSQRESGRATRRSTGPGSGARRPGSSKARGGNEAHRGPTWRQVLEALTGVETVLHFTHRRAYRFGLRSAEHEEMSRAQVLLHTFTLQVAVITGLQKAMEDEDMEAYESLFAKASKYPALHLMISEQKGAYEEMKRRRAAVDRITTILSDESKPLDPQEMQLVAAFRSAEEAQISADVLHSLRQQADARIQRERLLETLEKLRSERLEIVAHSDSDDETSAREEKERVSFAVSGVAQLPSIVSQKMTSTFPLTTSAVRSLIDEASKQLGLSLMAVQEAWSADALVRRHEYNKAEPGSKTPSAAPPAIAAKERDEEDSDGVATRPPSSASDADSADSDLDIALTSTEQGSKSQDDTSSLSSLDPDNPLARTISPRTRTATQTNSSRDMPPVKSISMFSRAQPAELSDQLIVHCEAVNHAITIADATLLANTIQLLETAGGVVGNEKASVPYVNRVLKHGSHQLEVLNAHVGDEEAAKELSLRVQELRRTRAWTAEDVSILTRRCYEVLSRITEDTQKTPVLENLRCVLRFQLDILRRQQHLLEMRENLRNQEAAAQARYQKDAKHREEVEREVQRKLQEEEAAANARRREEYYALWSSRARQLCHALQHAIHAGDVQSVRHCMKRCVLFQNEVKTGFVAYFGEKSNPGPVGGGGGSALSSATSIVQQLQTAVRSGQTFLEKKEAEVGTYFSGRDDVAAEEAKIPSELAAIIEAYEPQQFVEYLRAHEGELTLDVVMKVREKWDASTKRRRWVNQLHRAIHTAFALNSADLLQTQIDLAKAEDYIDDEVISAMDLVAVLRSKKATAEQQDDVSEENGEEENGQQPEGGEALLMANATPTPTTTTTTTTTSTATTALRNGEVMKDRSGASLNAFLSTIPDITYTQSFGSASDPRLLKSSTSMKGDGSATTSTEVMDDAPPTPVILPISSCAPAPRPGDAMVAAFGGPQVPTANVPSPSNRAPLDKNATGKDLVTVLYRDVVSLLQSPDNASSISANGTKRIRVSSSNTLLAAVVDDWLRIFQHRAKPAGVFVKTPRNVFEVLRHIGMHSVGGTAAAPVTKKLIGDFERIKLVSTVKAQPERGSSRSTSVAANEDDVQRKSRVLMEFILANRWMENIVGEFAQIGPATLSGVVYSDSALCVNTIVKDLLLIAQMCEQVDWPFSTSLEDDNAKANMSATAKPAVNPQAAAGRAGGGGLTFAEAAASASPSRLPLVPGPPKPTTGLPVAQVTFPTDTFSFALPAVTVPSSVKEPQTAPGAGGAEVAAAPAAPTVMTIADRRQAELQLYVTGMRRAVRALSVYFTQELRELGPMPSGAQMRQIFDESYHSQVGALVRDAVLPVLNAMLRSGFRSSFLIVRKRHVWDVVLSVVEHLLGGTRDLSNVDIVNAARLVQGLTDRQGRSRTRLQDLSDDQLHDLCVNMFFVQLLNHRKVYAFFLMVFNTEGVTSNGATVEGSTNGATESKVGASASAGVEESNAPSIPAVSPIASELLVKYYQQELCVCSPINQTGTRDLFSVVKQLSEISFALSADRNLL